MNKEEHGRIFLIDNVMLQLEIAYESSKKVKDKNLSDSLTNEIRDIAEKISPLGGERSISILGRIKEASRPKA